ncbi:hypothetical protein NSQ91_08885 [Paenibacillus sp. FSL R7-0048]|uniref:hypothetical protein n=1 Tax=Paenibacillus TaxID=44249 RepID=UPI00096EDCDA|nr:hypothetical protein [Paenibacillus odorifer]OMD73332.1 hypothetical protein BSK48_05575 [Paenibacillus odorifer]
MTQVKDMIDEKLDFALAEQLGWVNAWDGVRLVWLDGKTNEFRRKVTGWHPSTDPAASLEVQAKALELNYKAYIDHLDEFVNTDELTICSEPSYRAIASLLLASPRERAEAAYITLQQKE